MHNTNIEIDTRTVSERLVARRESEARRNLWARLDMEAALRDQFAALFI